MNYAIILKALSMHCAIIQIETNRKQYLDLLLLADEQESMINRYWKRGDMFVFEDNRVKAVCDY